MEEVLKRLVGICEEAERMDIALAVGGYYTNPFAKIFGEAADAIYYLIGDDKMNYQTFDESVTYIVLHSKVATGVKVKALLRKYEQRQNKTDPLG